MTEFAHNSMLETQNTLPAKILRVINRINNYFLALTSFAMFSVMCVEVFLRYVLRSDLNALEEYLFFIAVWAVFLGSANGSFEKSHVSADTISVIFKKPAILAAGEMIRQILTAFLSVAFAYYGATFLLGSVELGTVTTIHRIPYTIGHSAVAYGSFFMAVYQLYHFYEYIVTFFRGRKAARQTREEGGKA